MRTEVLFLLRSSFQLIAFSVISRSAIKFPPGIKAPDLLPKLLAKGVVMAGGLHKDVKDTYFRIVRRFFLLSTFSFRR